MSEIKLKPCPFCGGEAKLIEYKETVDGRGDKIARIRCECGSELHLTAREFSKAEYDFGYKGGYYSQNQKFWNGMHQRLIDKWNTRKPMANIVEKLEEESYETTDTVCGGRFKAIRLSTAINIVNQKINNGFE